MLFWSFCLLTFVQCVAGLIVSTLCRDFVTDANRDLALRDPRGDRMFDEKLLRLYTHGITWLMSQRNQTRLRPEVHALSQPTP